MRKFKRFSMMMLVLFISALLSTTASADCGSAPDPRYDTTGYARWCGCMGGQYNYQTTACVGAHSTPQTYPSEPSYHWYCRARAKNGAWGWGEYPDQISAHRRAMFECHIRSRGQACYIQYCKQVAPGSSVTSTPSVTRDAAYDCSLCHRKLIADVRSGMHSSSIRTYVAQALAGYENCKQKARGNCRQGDNLARSLRSGCERYHTVDAYRACVERIV